MVEIQLAYEGDLHCVAKHMPSGTVISTDAPVDNNGRGESFSPSDLVATAVPACMATIMGIVAKRKNISLEGMKMSVRKHMAEDLPRRIAKLEVGIQVPLPADHTDRKLLENAAVTCPVHQSIHPDIELVIDWHWQCDALRTVSRLDERLCEICDRLGSVVGVEFHLLDDGRTDDHAIGRLRDHGCLLGV